IHALAAAHEISVGAGIEAVAIGELIARELEPYRKAEADRVTITGPDRRLRADIAPIFSLVIHELATNAAKYGALSVDGGHVRIELADDGDDLIVSWREVGGPTVSPPDERGFGSTLIEQAVPYEMGGRAELSFEPSGVSAELTLPDHLFDREPELSLRARPRPIKVEEAIAPSGFDQIEGAALIVEDNFVIAQGMAQQLEDFGFDDVRMCGTVENALESLEDELPAFAILDVNLGHGATSEPIAAKLSDLGVPFVFVTGYGDNFDFPPALRGVAKLPKPVPSADLFRQVEKLLLGG
ncbi:MAG: response regulator, partial [Pseudomonadota bacterium]